MSDTSAHAFNSPSPHHAQPRHDFAAFFPLLYCYAGGSWRWAKCVKHMQQTGEKREGEETQSVGRQLQLFLADYFTL